MMPLINALYIVPTPIGNLDDITLRALTVLKQATLIAAEDTRHSRLLLDHFGIKPPRMLSCHNYNEAERADAIADEIAKGGIVALVSDAGSPLINDPGFRVVRALAQRGIKIIPLPGPCALITALEGAGLPTDHFEFYGFVPVKAKEKRACLTELISKTHTCIFYESPKRVLDTVTVLAELMPDRDIVLARELTKAFESIYRLKAGAAVEFLSSDPDHVRGEFVLAVGPAVADLAKDQVPPQVTAALSLLRGACPVKLAAQALSQACGLNRNAVYTAALKLKQNEDAKQN